MGKRVADLTDKELEHWLGEAEYKEYQERKLKEQERRRFFARMRIKKVFGDTVPDQEINHHKEH